MDTSEVAEYLNTTPRLLRAFLRSPISTYAAVGSGSRYEFTSRDLPTIEKRFNEWKGAGKPKPSTAPKTPNTKARAAASQAQQDTRVWDDEESLDDGVPELEDIRDPRVRARVRRAADDAENRLALLLLAKGLHITQLGDRESA